MGISPATIDKPTFGDKAGFLFGLIPVGSSAQRHKSARAAAESIAKSDRAKAYAGLEKIERLLYWETQRDPACTHELEATIILHARMLREDGDKQRAAGLLLLARCFAPLTSDPASIGFLADSLAASGDSGETAISIYVDHIAAAAKKKAGTPDSVATLLAKTILPDQPLGNPDKKQRGLGERILKADPNCGFALYCSALAAYHDQKYSKACELAAKARKCGWTNPGVSYLEHISAGRLAFESADYVRAVDKYDKAGEFAADDLTARMGLAEAASAYGWDNQEQARDGVDRVIEILTRGRRAVELVLEKNPDDAAVTRMSGRLSLLLGELDPAIKALEKSLKTDKNPDAMADLAMALLLCGDLSACAKTIEKALKAYPEHVGVLCMSGADYFAREEWSKAAAAYAKALKVDPAYVPAIVGHGKALAMNQDAGEAVDILRKAASAGSREAKLWLGRALMRNGEMEEAARVLEELCDLGGRVREHYYAASALAQMGRYPEALTHLDAARSISDANAELETLYVKVCLSAGMLQQAGAHCRRLHEIALDHPEYAYLRACVSYLSGDSEEARAAIEELSGEAVTPERSLALAIMSLKDGNTAAAIDYARRGKSDGDDGITLQVIAAAALAREARWDEVKAELGGSPEQSAALPDMWLWLMGQASYETGDYESAIEWWTRLLERHPDLNRLSLNINRLHYMVGRKKADAGDYLGAIESWKAFGETREDDPELRADVGELFFRAARERLTAAEEDELIKAMELIGEAGKLLQHSAKVCLYRGLIDLRRGQASSAVQMLQKAARSDDRRFAELAGLWLGLAHLANDDHQEAVSVLNRIASKAGSEIVVKAAKHSLAIAMARANQWREAVDAIDSLAGKGG